MTWLDDQGIAHDGEPPTGYRVFGGRWYPLNDRTQTDEREYELVAAS